MKLLSLEKMACVEGGSCYTGQYCPLAFVVLFAGYKTGSFFAKVAGKALKQALCTPCGIDTPFPF